MIRKASREDIPAIRALIQSVPGLWEQGWREDVLERALASASGLALVAEEQGEVVGFVCAHDLGFRGYLSELAVDEQVRGRGIGAALVGAVEQRLAERGCSLAIADVWYEAEGFYRRLGWGQPDVVLLRKYLDREADE
jgi:predicted N-acetyltransferase YhbS